MTLTQLSTYLHMSRNTVLKLVDEKTIPGVQIESEWRFRRGEIDEWLSTQRKSDYDDFEDVVDGMHLPLGDLMPHEAIIHDMRAPDALGAIEELAARAYNEKWLNDKPWFIGSLVERETLASTAMEGGVAFLHTRSRDASKLKRPFVICGRSYEGIDFGAPDGKPTFVFFLLGLKYDKLHLPILGRLARLTMRSPTIISRLRSTTSPIKMRAILLKLDAEELSARKIPKVGLRAPAQPVFDPKQRLRQIMKLNAKRLFEQKKHDDAEAKEAKKEAAKVKRETARKQKAELAKSSRVKKTATATDKAKKAAAAKVPVKKPSATKEPAQKAGPATTSVAKAPAKKAATAKTPAKKAAPAKTPAKKTPAKKAVPAKTPAKKAPASKKK